LEDIAEIHGYKLGSAREQIPADQHERHVPHHAKRRGVAKHAVADAVGVTSRQGGGLALVRATLTRNRTQRKANGLLSARVRQARGAVQARDRGRAPAHGCHGPACSGILPLTTTS
jgi:hypothetical protein